MAPSALRSVPFGDLARLAPLQQALWHEAHGDWKAAHHLAQDIDTPAGAWVHAYLHRREGDLTNAAYWYRRAGKPTHTGPFADEWDAIAESLARSSSTP